MVSAVNNESADSDRCNAVARVIGRCLSGCAIIFFISCLAEVFDSRGLDCRMAGTELVGPSALVRSCIKSKKKLLFKLSYFQSPNLTASFVGSKNFSSSSAFITGSSFRGKNCEGYILLTGCSTKQTAWNRMMCSLVHSEAEHPKFWMVSSAWRIGPICCPSGVSIP